MRNWTNLSGSLAVCRLEWRPSWWGLGTGALITLLAVAALWLSALPWWLALPVALTVAGSAARRLHAERRSAGLELLIPWDRHTPVTVAGVAVEAFEVEWRGSLAMLRWRVPGRRREARLWWPDLLPPAARRELRLAVAARAVWSDERQVAP